MVLKHLYELTHTQNQMTTPRIPSTVYYILTTPRDIRISRPYTSWFEQYFRSILIPYMGITSALSSETMNTTWEFRILTMLIGTSGTETIYTNQDIGSRTSKKLGSFLDSWNNSALTTGQYRLLYCPGYSGGYRFGNTKLKYRTWNLLEA